MAAGCAPVTKPSETTVTLPSRAVVITIDDAPFVGEAATANARLLAVRSILATLEKHNAPCVAFFNMSRHAQMPETTAAWRHPSITVGNHTFSHLHAGKVALKEFIEDVRLGDQAVRRYFDVQGEMPFRFPYLAQGGTPERRQAIHAALKRLHNRQLPVTIETQDWLYAAHYRNASDERGRKQASKLWHHDLRESTLEAEYWADVVYGRQTPQVLLLHANQLTAAELDAGLTWLASRGYRFVEANVAWQHELFQRIDHSTSPIGEPLHKRLYRSRNW